MTAVLLLDRDGTLIEDVSYPKDPARVRLLPGAAEAVRSLVEAGFVPAVVSNQSGVGRGLITHEEYQAVHERFVQVFEAASGVRLPCFYCLHTPEDGCDCRKPKVGLLQQATQELGMIGKPGVMIGDKPSDGEAGEAMGFLGLRFRGDWAAMTDECLKWAGGRA